MLFRRKENLSPPLYQGSADPPLLLQLPTYSLSCCKNTFKWEMRRKTMKCWECSVILSMKVNTNSMELNNNYQSSLSSLSASLKKMFFVRKKALAERSWLKLLTSILMNSYPEFSRDSSFLLSDIILPKPTNMLWVYIVEGGQLWCEIANSANAGLAFPLSCQK